MALHFPVRNLIEARILRLKMNALLSTISNTHYGFSEESEILIPTAKIIERAR